MGMNKRLIVLANSVKRHAHCVAGREILPAGAGVGGWVRPVSGEEQGELLDRHIQIGIGRLPQVLDIIDVPVLGPAQDPGQPENWQIDETRRWSHVGQHFVGCIPLLDEKPPDLWNERGGPTDRIAVRVHAVRAPLRSIALVSPERFRVQLWTELDTREQRSRRRTRAVFLYRGVEYNLPVTDPGLDRRHDLKHPGLHESPREEPLRCGDACRLCISLTPPFYGFHYKVVAAVIELI